MNRWFDKIHLISSSFLLCFLLSTHTIFANNNQKTNFRPHEKKYLVNLMEQEGFQPAFLKQVFYSKQLKKIPVIISKNVINKESKRSYDNFLSPYSIHLAKQFSRQWKTILKRASNKFDVDREVLISILLVETGIGRVLGNYPVISIFSSILVENHNQKNGYNPQSAAMVYDSYRIKRLRKKASWAHKELVAFLQMVRKNQHNPFKIKGSFAGAFGIPQFLPSSYLKWGYDSDKNGSVNLYLIPDAVYSVANYLKAHGWKKGLHHVSNRQVIRKYNNSRLYVDAVLGVAEKMNRIYRKRSENSTSSYDEVSTVFFKQKQGTAIP